MAVKILSINQLMNLFSQFSEAHFMLNDWGNGPTSEIGTSRQMKFPYLWATYRNSSTINVQNRTSIPTMNLSFLVVDQINNQANIADSTDLNSDNQQEIISDTFQICQDLIQFISTELKIYGVTIGDASVNMEPVFDETDDKVTGWLMDIPLIISHYNCVIPLSGFTGYSPLTTPVQPAQYLTCETVTLCESLGLFVDNKIAMAISGITSENYYTTGATLNGNTVIFNRNDTLSAYTVDLSTLSPDLSGYLPTSGGTITGNLNVSGTTSLLDINYNDGNAAYGKILTSDANGNATWEYPITYATQIYMFSSANSSITGYEQAVVLPIYASATTASITSAVTTSETLIASFATNANYPNITFIPAGNILVHYETQKASGSNNYYSYAKIYKRTTGGTETLLGISDNSSQTALNTLQQVTVSIVIGNTVLDVTDRIVVKVYAIMLASTANITVFYDDNTNSRLELPVSVVAGTTSFVPYSGAIQDVDLNTKNLSAGVITANTYLGLPTDVRVTGGTYTNGTATFTNNTGGTFSVSGFSTGSSFTGGTVSGATNFTGGLSANTISATSINSLLIQSGGTDLNAIFVEPATVETISNKRITKRRVIVASSATPTLNTDNADIAILSGLSVNVTNFSTNLTGTPVHGDMFCYEITDSGSIRTLSWGAQFAAGGTLTLPTATVANTLLKVLFEWDSAANVWRITAWA